MLRSGTGGAVRGFAACSLPPAAPWRPCSGPGVWRQAGDTALEVAEPFAAPRCVVRILCGLPRPAAPSLRATRALPAMLSTRSGLSRTLQPPASAPPPQATWSPAGLWGGSVGASTGHPGEGLWPRAGLEEPRPQARGQPEGSAGAWLAAGGLGWCLGGLSRGQAGHGLVATTCQHRPSGSRPHRACSRRWAERMLRRCLPRAKISCWALAEERIPHPAGEDRVSLRPPPATGAGSRWGDSRSRAGLPPASGPTGGSTAARARHRAPARTGSAPPAPPATTLGLGALLGVLSVGPSGGAWAGGRCSSGLLSRRWGQG